MNMNCVLIVRKVPMTHNLQSPNWRYSLYFEDGCQSQSTRHLIWYSWLPPVDKRSSILRHSKMASSHHNPSSIRMSTITSRIIVAKIRIYSRRLQPSKGRRRIYNNTFEGPAACKSTHACNASASVSILPTLPFSFAYEHKWLRKDKKRGC